MAKISYVSTASFCVENARELGIPAALLLDKIVRLSKHTIREDGFCWYTAKQFEEETSLKKDAFDRAAHKLEDYGIVERKVTYIVGTMNKATHFRLSPENEQKEETEGGSEPHSTKPVKTTFRINNKNTINSEKSRKRVSSASPIGSAEDALPSGELADARSSDEPTDASTNTDSPSARPFINEEKIPSDPFIVDSLMNSESLEPNRFSLKQDEEDRKKEKGVAVLVGELMKISGIKGSVNGTYINKIKSSLKDYTPDELREVAKWAKTHDFYKGKGFMTRFSRDACEQWYTSKKPSVPKDEEGGTDLNLTY